MKKRLKRKILIITLTPLGSNYGGLLQAYALQRVLRALGHDVHTHNRTSNILSIRSCMGAVKRFLFRHLLGRRVTHISSKMNTALSLHTQRFLDSNLSTVDIQRGRRTPRPADIAAYDTFIAGSDQVWRKEYANVEFGLFNFVRSGDATLLSYAASFGKGDISEYSSSLISKTAILAKRLSGVSVREESGIEIAAKHWGVKAERHVDPTLLIDRAEYQEIASGADPFEGDLFVYVLDRSEVKNSVIEYAKERTGYSEFELLPVEYPSAKDLMRSPEKYSLPPVEKWIRAFSDSQFVVTDSFHGTVFAIIFNKPFIAIGNKGRGLARFESLLKMFDLQDRLVLGLEDVSSDMLSRPIDWGYVNSVISSERSRSVEYLKRTLGGDLE